MMGAIERVQWHPLGQYRREWFGMSALRLTSFLNLDMMLSSTHGVMANANAIRAGTITLAVLMSTNAAAPMAFWPSASPRSGALPVEAHTVPYLEWPRRWRGGVE